MRSNKFRGIGIDTEEWAYGYFTECEEEADNGCIGHLYKRITIKLPYIVNLKNEATMVKPETVGQSTGLPDRNGKEIFDGDVVEGEKYSGKPGIYNNHTGVVKFRHESFSSFGINQYKGQEAKINSLFEIIGNIYGNPELLEVTK